MYRIVLFLLLVSLGSCEKKEETMSDLEGLAVLDDEEEEGELLGELKQEEVAGELFPVPQELILQEEPGDKVTGYL